MDRLRQIFESMGFSNVETFIASGNVIFESTSKNVKALEAKIERELRQSLGYEVATFIRTESELIEIASHKAFSQSQVAAARALYVVFINKTPDEESRLGLMALQTDIDDFYLRGREVYWLCRKKQSESTISNIVFSKALGMPSTIRGVNTVQRMIAKYMAAKE
jgi:uncharacterized protein (DUF1697 family)